MQGLNLAVRFSDQIVMLHQGWTFCTGAPGTILTGERIRTVYGAKTEVYRRKGYFFVYPLRCAKGATCGHPAQQQAISIKERGHDQSTR
jgi:ABC-type hemin transport system ATPase subunit|uniref:ABC transporter ATP-binding protein n=1 Tax=Desulfobacca acetoxidans TaxID=60893 RepID=A0A7C3UXQ2_9BACT